MARRKKLRIEPSTPDSGEGTSAVDVEPAPPRQPARRSLRGKRGGLKDMPNMPMDILLEIFGYLHPRDLLNMARTSKEFREYLMSRKSAFLWKAARQNVEGLPDCPPYFSEPAYANLAFFSYCHGCFKGNIQNVIWEFRVRYCTACKKAKTTDIYYFEIPRHVQARVRITDLMTSIHAFRRTLYHTPEIEEIQASFRALADKPDEQTKLASERVALMKTIREHTAKCWQWQAAKYSVRSTELDNTRKQRFEAIFENLQELGWKEELALWEPGNYWPLKQHAHVRVAKPLTERGWQKIRNELVAFMEDEKATRLRGEHRRLLISRLSALSGVIADYYSESPRSAATELAPQFVDFAFMPEFRDLADAPNDTDISAQSFQALRPQMPTLIERWQTEVKAQLTSKITKELKVPENVEPFDLAVAFFDCDHCGMTLRYPAIVAHKCLRRVYASYLDSSMTDIYDRVACHHAHKRKWSSTSVNFARVLERIRPVLQTMGLSPYQTAQEVDDRDVRLVLIPKNNNYTRRVMTWRKAVSIRKTNFDLCVDGVLS
ncbi:hypothetical protein B0H21DRAFT_818443 [Amylocystis lapponica]|nr:hypothetical protein B0H21DRAFT_818443 [Amylocystis lapponica]